MKESCKGCTEGTKIIAGFHLDKKGVPYMTCMHYRVSVYNKKDIINARF